MKGGIGIRRKISAFDRYQLTSICWVKGVFFRNQFSDFNVLDEKEDD